MNKTKDQRIDELEQAIERLTSAGSMFVGGVRDGWHSLESMSFPRNKDYRLGFELGLKISPMLQKPYT